jgi:hypothetical protein
MRRNNKQTLTTILGILLIGIAGYFGFKPLFEYYQKGVIKEFLAAVFGTIFTIVLTMFLLNKQTEIEEENAQGQKIFEEKINLYKDIIALVRDVFEDGKLSVADVRKLEFMLVNLQMVSSDETMEIFMNFYEELNSIFQDGSDEDSNNAIKEDFSVEVSNEKEFAILEKMLLFAARCRFELGLSQSENANKNVSARTKDLLTETQEFIASKGQKNYYNGFDDLVKASWAAKYDQETLDLTKACYSRLKEYLNDRKITVKYTKSNIPFANENSKQRGKNFLYLHPKKGRLELGLWNFVIDKEIISKFDGKYSMRYGKYSVSVKSLQQFESLLGRIKQMCDALENPGWKDIPSSEIPQKRDSF